MGKGTWMRQFTFKLFYRTYDRNASRTGFLGTLFLGILPSRDLDDARVTRSGHYLLPWNYPQEAFPSFRYHFILIGTLIP